MNLDDFQNHECPMTNSLQEKYKINDSWAKKFCEEGCSIECGKILFKEIIEKRIKGCKELPNEYEQLFDNFLQRFFKTLPKKDKKTFEPLKVKLSESNDGTYLIFDYKNNENPKQLNVTIAETWY